MGDEEENERVMVMRGLVAAREAFDKVLTDEGIEGAFYKLDLKCFRLATDYATPLWSVSDKEERNKEATE